MYYFAYASNLNKAQMRSRCPESKPLFTAVLPNHKIVFTGWERHFRGGTATIKSSWGDKVRGAIYEVNDTCLRQLDKFEGVAQGTSTRLNVTVFSEDNQALQAVTYIKPGQMEETKPSEQYGEIIRQGYRDWGIV